MVFQGSQFDFKIQGGLSIHCVNYPFETNGMREPLHST